MIKTNMCGCAGTPFPQGSGWIQRIAHTPEPAKRMDTGTSFNARHTPMHQCTSLYLSDTATDLRSYTKNKKGAEASQSASAALEAPLGPAHAMLYIAQVWAHHPISHLPPPLPFPPRVSVRHIVLVLNLRKENNRAVVEAPRGGWLQRATSHEVTNIHRRSCTQQRPGMR